MYNLREDLFERDEEEGIIPYEAGTILDPGASRPNSHSTGVSYSRFASQSILEESDDEEIYFPSYDEPFHSVSKISISNHTSRPESPTEILVTKVGLRPIEHAEDDIEARVKPSRHVDYLSHEWTEEEIASSWKYIISKRKVHPNSERLENASWRTWEKKRSNLRTVSPETVKWLKDHDVTWLYGPLQPDLRTLETKSDLDDNNQGSEAHSTRQTKKSCLKKRTLPELMLQQSICLASLRSAASTAEAQMNKTLDASTYSFPIFNIPAITRAHTTGMPSLTLSPNNSTSSVSSDSGTWASKNVRFHELVEQCIALEGLPNLDSESDFDQVSDSEDEAWLMRRRAQQWRTAKKWPSIVIHKKVEAKTIEKLPHATLKSPGEIGEAASSRCGLGISQATTREITFPSSQVATLQFHNDEDSDNNDDEYWEPPSQFQSRRDSIQILHDKLDAIRMRSSPLDSTKDSSSLHHPALGNRYGMREDTLYLEKGPRIVGQDASTALEPPPYRPEFASFSFTHVTTNIASDVEEGEWSPFTTSSSWVPDPVSCSAPALDPAKAAIVNKVMQEFWVLFHQSHSTLLGRRGEWKSSTNSEKCRLERDPEPLNCEPDSGDQADYELYLEHELPKLVRERIEAIVTEHRTLDPAAISADLESIIQTCQDQVISSYRGTSTPPPIPETQYHSFYTLTSLDDDEDEIENFGNGGWSPRTSSDEGYGSEERGEAWKVRDVSASTEEKERGIYWEMYPDAWDED